MSGLDWNKVRISNQLVKNYELSKKKKKYFKSTYRNGDFFIGTKRIERYYPEREPTKEHGIFFNAATAKFEAWKKTKLLSSIPWKVGQRILTQWIKQF